MPNQLNTEQFIERSRAVHGALYDYSQTIYKAGAQKLGIICPDHGAFHVAPFNHLASKVGCPACSKKNYVNKRADIFITKAIKKHENKYDYSRVKFINQITKVELICKKHGSFYQTPNAHLLGRGCPKCGKANHIGWTRTSWTGAQNSREAVLYIIQLYNKNESFYKVGITFDFKRRFKKDMPYQFRTVALYKSNNASTIYDLEKVLHRKLKSSKYTPVLSFAGYTECFTDIANALPLLPSETFFLSWAKERISTQRLAA